jgi:hypothetical protein
MTLSARARWGIAIVAALAVLAPAASIADPGNGHGQGQANAGAGPAAAGGGAKPAPAAQPAKHARATKAGSASKTAVATADPTATEASAPTAATPVRSTGATADPTPAGKQRGSSSGHANGRRAREAAATPAPAPVVAAPVAAPAAPAPRATSRRARLVVGDASRIAARRPAQAPRMLAGAFAPLAAAPVSAPAAVTDHPAARRATRHAAAGKPAAPAGPVVRTVTRILHLIPLELRLALAALALLGLVLGVATVMQTLRSRRLERVRRSLLADVGVLQSALLPDLPERVGAARVSAAYRPAGGLAAGGDFFDAFALPGGRTALIVGDVAGHGRDVVPLTAAVRYSLRAYLEAGLPPRAVLHVASNALAGQLGERQVTVVVAVYEPSTGQLTYACAGHWPPLLIGVPGPVVTACSSPPLGVGLPTGRRQTTVTLPAGGAACFFTDGLMDVAERGERLGPDGLRREYEALGPDASAGDLVARLVERTSQQADDMAACVLAPLPGTPAHDGPRVEVLEVDAGALSRQRVARFLRACGATESEARRAIEEAWGVVDRAGSAVLEAWIAADAVWIGVREPAASPLRVPALEPVAGARVA